MKNLFCVAALALCAFMPADSPWFSGKIMYHNTFTTLAGQDVTAKLAPVLGNDDPYYISDNNYKMYNEKQQLLELYTGVNNQFLFFMNGQATPAVDAGVGAGTAVVTPLKQTTTVAGYPCQSLQMDNAQAGTSTVYFYSPKLRVNPERFSKHAMGDFYTYLKAANGALPLRIVLTNKTQGFVMTSEATAVQAMALTAEDFTATAPAR